MREKEAAAEHHRLGGLGLCRPQYGPGAVRAGFELRRLPDRDGTNRAVGGPSPPLYRINSVEQLVYQVRRSALVLDTDSARYFDAVGPQR